MLGRESANAKQPKKKKKTYTSCAGAWADAGGACGNTAEGVGGRPVSDNLEKSVSKGKKKMQREKEHTVPGRQCRGWGADKQ